MMFVKPSSTGGSIQQTTATITRKTYVNIWANLTYDVATPANERLPIYLQSKIWDSTVLFHVSLVLGREATCWHETEGINSCLQLDASVADPFDKSLFRVA